MYKKARTLAKKLDIPTDDLEFEIFQEADQDEPKDESEKGLISDLLRQLADELEKK